MYLNASEIERAFMKTIIQITLRFIWYSQHFEYKQNPIQTTDVIGNVLSFEPLPAAIVMETLHFRFQMFFQIWVNLASHFPCCNDDDTTCKIY